VTQLTYLCIHKYPFRFYAPIFSKFMDISDTNYKLIDYKYIFGVCGPKRHTLIIWWTLMHFILKNIEILDVRKLYDPLSLWQEIFAAREAPKLHQAAHPPAPPSIELSNSSCSSICLHDSFPKNQSSTTSSCAPCIFSPSQSKKIAAQAPVILPPPNLHLGGHISSLSMDLLQARAELVFYFCKTATANRRQPILLPDLVSLVLRRSSAPRPPFV
jgi:hypothetical protein